MALPFLTLLAPSKRFYTNNKRTPKTLLDWARQAALQIHRWLPDRYVVLVADSAFAAIEFLAAVRNCVCVVTRLRLDANLFDFPPPQDISLKNLNLATAGPPTNARTIKSNRLNRIVNALQAAAPASSAPWPG
jgi:hypothetical protein